MKIAGILFSLLLVGNIAKAQIIINNQAIDSSITFYKQSFQHDYWIVHDPVFGIVFNCVGNDSIYWSVTCLAMAVELEWFNPDYYHQYGNEFVMIRMINCTPSNFEDNTIYPLNDSSLALLRNALYPESVLMSMRIETQIFYQTEHNHTNFLISLVEHFPSRYENLFPYKPELIKW